MDRRTFLRGMALTGVSGALAACAASPSPSPRRAGTALVIGAGAAGLAAATRLTEAGLQVTVLEARDRIGGRMWTSTALGVPIDLGASWIHGTTDNPVLPLAQAVRANLVPTSDDRFGTYDPDGRRIPWAVEEPMWTRWEAVLAAATGGIADDRTATEALAAAAAALGDPPDGVAPDALDAYLAWCADLEIGEDWAADVDALSSHALTDGVALGGLWVMLKGGYASILEPVAAALDVRRSSVVSDVAMRDDEVVVTTVDGQRHAADLAVVTLPLGVLQAGDVRFDPPLPDALTEAIGRLGMGSFLKVVLRFAERSWPNGVDWLGRIGEPTFGEFVDLQATTGAPTVVGFAAGTEARRLETLADDAVVAEAMRAYRAVVGAATPDPTDALVTRWGADPFARGAYSHLAVGATPADRRALTEPIGTRLALAGEATHERFPATVHGAWSSGLEAADRLLALTP